MRGGSRSATPPELLLPMLDACDRASEAANRKLTGEEYEAIAAAHYRSGKWLARKHRQQLNGESVQPRGRGGAHNVVIDDDLAEIICDLALRCPASQLAELRETLAAITGVEVSTSTISRHLDRRGVTLKRKTAIPPAKFSEFNVAWHGRYTAAMAHRPAATLHFFDETMVSCRDQQGRLMHWSLAGEPAYSFDRPQVSYKYSCAALTSIGAAAPPILVQVYDTTTLATDVAQFFYYVVMETDILSPGDTVILDNAKTHCGGNELLIRAMLMMFGVDLVFLPPYSPERNPIELAFAKFKFTLRYRMPVRHTREETQQAIVAAFEQITHNDIVGYYRHCGHVH
eukprot:TRINITY_DN5643_c0_g1_i1.p1 TRINITY_DN5643_c0_g1~~TRINITY_DN5643_c0_g1_i1.p1  ORF type:complete len:381 (-),score=32.17 TRINITY_DN5643_c0_g1_i1:107-1132(-)